MKIPPDQKVLSSSEIPDMARDLQRHILWSRVMRIAAGVLVLLLSILYVVALMVTRFGRMTIAVDPYVGKTYALSLCETPDFRMPTGVLNVKDSRHMTNISERDLPADIDHINGDHSGDNYLAYTFYLKNVGTNTVDVSYSMRLANVTRHLDRALRVRVYLDGVPTTYAKTRSDGGGAEEGCLEFLTNDTILHQQIQSVASGDVRKFTIVLWLEGNDADCVDTLIGGSLKATIKFTALED